MIVDAWITIMQDVLTGGSNTMPGWCAIGTGSTAISASDTALVTEVFRKAHDTSEKIDSDTVRFKTKILSTEANGNVLREYGEFNATSGGTIMNRQVFASITKASSFELRIETEVEITDQ